MPDVLQRCTTTGLRVQSWIADDPTDGDDNAYLTITSYACTRVHIRRLVGC